MRRTRSGAGAAVERRAGVLLVAGVLWLGHGCAAMFGITPEIDPEGPVYEFTDAGSFHARVVEGVYVGTRERDGVSYHAYEFAGALEGEDRRLQVMIPVVPVARLSGQVYLQEFSREFSPVSGTAFHGGSALLDIVPCRIANGPPSTTHLTDFGGSTRPGVLRLRLCGADLAWAQVAWGPEWNWYPAEMAVEDYRRADHRRRVENWRKAEPWILGGLATTAAVGGCVAICGGGGSKMGPPDQGMMAVNP